MVIMIYYILLHVHMTSSTLNLYFLCLQWIVLALIISQFKKRYRQFNVPK